VSAPVDRGVRRDPQQPRPERPPLIVTVELHQRGEERVMGRVIGVGYVVQHRPGHAAHRLLVALNERPEGRAIAGKRAHHEGDVVFTTVAHALGDRCTHERYTNRIPRRLNRRALSAGAKRHSYSLALTRASSTIQVGTGARRDPLVVDKMRHALAAALAVPVLWASTLAYPLMGLTYCVAMVALDGIEQVVRRLKVSRRRTEDR